MPLTVNVGISRKASANYQSAGLSINLTAELDQSLLADPPRLQSEIDRIYRQAEEALDRKAGGVTTAAPATEPHAAISSAMDRPAERHGVAANGSGNGNGHGNGSQNGHATNGSAYGGMIRPATESQVRALRAICKRHRLDLDREAHEEFGVEGADQLDVKQASALIDLLKDRVQAAPAASGGRRWRP
jgi:hypothetical protein